MTIHQVLMVYNLSMNITQKRFSMVLLFMATIYFSLFIFPNMVASQNLSMVQMFEPDEAVILPYVYHMIAPVESLNQTLRNIIFYEYYYYGFPFFGISALVVLPLQLLGQISNLPLVLLILRQLVTVLPVLLGLLLLVYLQDGFRSYRSPLLFAFLLSVPAVVQNNFWWHPDGLIFFLVVLTIYFLKKDNLRFGWNFLIAAILCGIATAVKLVGLYFFMAVGLTLFLGLFLKKATWKRLSGMAIAYLMVMGLAFLVANPFLLSHWSRTTYLNIFNLQTRVLSEGYGIVYDKGLLASWPVIHQYYGQLIFLFISVGVALWRAWRGPQRLLHALILAWLVPISVTVFYFTHFKFQYWLPATLPLFSSLVVLLPEKREDLKRFSKSRFVQFLLLAIILVQFSLFLYSDIQNYNNRTQRAVNNPRIEFFDKVTTALSPVSDIPLHIYYDYRMYFPGSSGWVSDTSYDLLNYTYIRDGNFDVLLLLEQRIRDYLNPATIAIDPDQFALDQKFYQDAENGTVTGYQLVYRDFVGLIYISDDLYQLHFPK
jgi:hypothetical protein